MNAYLIATCVLSFVLLVSLYFNYKFARVILRMEDAIEQSLDDLDERYGSIQKILDTPLFFDSPQVRQVIEDITACRNAVLRVANQLTEIENGQKKED